MVSNPCTNGFTVIYYKSLMYVGTTPSFVLGVAMYESIVYTERVMPFTVHLLGGLKSKFPRRNGLLAQAVERPSHVCVCTYTHSLNTFHMLSSSICIPFMLQHLHI